MLRSKSSSVASPARSASAPGSVGFPGPRASSAYERMPSPSSQAECSSAA